MMFKLFKLFIILTMGVYACSSSNKCPENINLLPMYGTEPKCQEQIDADKRFIDGVINHFENRKKAADYYADKGWESLYKSDYQSAMKRFNQAWLLDSTNAKVYWGFGNLFGIQQDFLNATKYLEKSIGLDTNNSNLYEDNALTYAQLFLTTNDNLYLLKSIKNFKKAIHLDSNNVRALAQLTTTYTYNNQKDSAEKYLIITDKIDSKAINSDVRRILTNK